MNVRTRVALIVAAQTALVILAVSLVLFLALRSFLQAGEVERLEQLLPAFERSLRALPENGPSGTALAQPAVGVDARVLEGGRVTAKSANFPPLPVSLPPGFHTLAGHQVLVAPIRLGNRAATAQLAADLGGVQSPLRAYLRALAVALLFSVALVAWGGALTARRLLAPVRELEQAAARVRLTGELRAAMPGAGRPDELGRLAKTLEDTLTHLAALRERETEFTRAAAHDLRSPLAALSVRLDGALAQPRTDQEYREELREMRRDVARMTRLTEHLLLLARGGEAVRLSPLDLAAVVSEGVDRARERAPDVRLDYEARGDTHVLGDAALLAHLIDNLLENGLRHGVGADVRVCVAQSLGGESLSGESGQGVRLTVEDDGPGVPENALARLAEPFYRVDAARGGEGNGLGLAIARRVAELHGASLAFKNRAGSGLRVTVDFPSMNSPAPREDLGIS